jgi:AbrB family transcriptional regulator (stage V sporulation protein T)
MKTTGVVRRIDDLGRIVIPKEIRRSLKIRDGESMEIFVDNEYIALKKYSCLDDLVSISKELVETISNEFKKSVFITDMNKIIAWSGNDRSTYFNKNISSFIYDKITESKKIDIEDEIIQLIDGEEIKCNCLIFPIIANGDVKGSIAIMSEKERISANEEQILKVVAQFLGKQVEE